MKAFRRPFLLLLPLLVALPLLPACLRSRVHITTEPAGAEVAWRGQPYGATPITIPFIWYWYYDFTLSKPGYVTQEHLERFRTPPWFLMPFDLIMEILPIPIPDNRYRHYVLQPQKPGEAALAAEDLASTQTLQAPPASDATPNRLPH